MTAHSALHPRVDAPWWRLIAEHPFFFGMLLLAPIVWLMPPLPIDETRYLAVAWEMRHTVEFLVPHLNGEVYPHKPPMLFWLINLGWLITGVHAWTARAMTLACSALSLILLYRLTLRVSGSANAARLSMWLLLGAIYFAGFANAIMFDVPLTTCVLLAVHGIVDLTEARMRRGILVAGVAIGLGILVKGPVMLLDIAFVALAAPWWCASRLEGRRVRYFGAFALAVLLGVVVALAWAIPAAVHGGDAYARAIFLNQTFDRIEGVKGASTHGRPWWWYGLVFPLMLLPWPLVLRMRVAQVRAALAAPALRMAIVWVLPTFVVFSLIAGKQPHYLLPAIAGVALGFAFLLDRGDARVRGGLYALILIAVGVAVALVPSLSSSNERLAYIAGTSPWWGVAIALVGVVFGFFGRHASGPSRAAIATLGVALLVKLMVLEGPGERYDVSAISARIRDIQASGRPIAQLGWHHGVYEFAGRLTEPLLTFEEKSKFDEWAAKHPDGLVISWYRRFRFAAKPLYTQTFRGGEISMWNVRDAVASGIDPTSAHATDGSDDASDD